MKRKISKVPIQKGKINPDPVAMATETFMQKVSKSNAENQLRRSGRETVLKTPKK